MISISSLSSFTAALFGIKWSSSSTYLMFAALLLMIIMGTWAGAVAAGKGRNMQGWFLFGFFIPIIGVVAAYAVKPSADVEAIRTRKRALDTKKSLEELVTSADAFFLPLGWNEKTRVENQRVYERKIHGKIWLTVSLSLFTIVGGVVYYFLSDRTDALVLQMMPLDGGGTRMEIAINQCQTTKSIKDVNQFINTIENA